jgi:alkanesulfonate monooxygenase SsuD/methylene tetrahydromethanopterin reductase-like flavin-dependent oxidoreductase (luciferase family)
MKFDVIFEMATDEPDDRRAVQRVYGEALEEIEVAEANGFATAWETEHHFLREFSHSTAPEVFLASAARATKRIRLGHGCTLLPHNFNHPIRVAERVAVLDIVSDGRVELGTARSSEFEQGGFGIDPRDTRVQWQEAITALPQMWADGEFSFDGEFLQVPPRQVLPKPIQDPHPPLWLACTSPESWRIAGLNGVGALGFSHFANAEEIAERISTYTEALEHAVPPGGVVNKRVAISSMVHCAEDGDQARAEAFDAIAWIILNTFRLLSPKSADGGWGGLRPDTAATMQAIEAKAPEMYDRLHAQNAIIVGSPDECIEKIKTYEALGVDHLICHMSLRGLAHEKTVHAMELFGKYVIPAFEDGDVHVRETAAAVGG